MNECVNKCEVCPRKCGVIRGELSGSGFCKMGTKLKVARVGLHYWEEPCISGTNGSGAIFFSGCSLGCVYCQNFEISSGGKGEFVTPRQLADNFKILEEKGANNINLVTASHYIDGVISALDIYKPSIPVVYNCGGYESVGSIKRLDGYVDIFLPDFKYADDKLAVKYSKAPDYTQTTLNAIKQMLSQVGNIKIDDNGIMHSGVLIRHLVLPNHTKNSIAVLDLIKDNFGTSVPVSLMGQYFPTDNILKNADKYDKLTRKLTKREYNKVADYMVDLGLDGFYQGLDSADKSYVPDWDFKL